ncbi:serine threonine protein kinase [Aspergillus sclerotialis]|uniref:Serine threonine protein kinase n=1 Tax=Aspergillus sclerotialis TaxID=2070753 RepID=A0A3A3A6S8_9EURO|nr:serine threonine protein kinase [Aspergillus sclerotialis]
MTDRPGLVQKRVSARHFVQIPSEPPDSEGTRPSDATIDTPLPSMSKRSKLARTGARKARNWTPCGSHGAFYRGAYEPPTLLQREAGLYTGAVPEEKTGLFGGDEYGNMYGYRKSSAPTAGSIDEPDGGLTGLARFYRRIVDYSAVTKYMVYILPLALVLAVPIIIGATLAKDAEIGGVRVCCLFTWIEVIWVGFWASKLLAYCVPYIFRFLVSVVSPGRKGHAKALQAMGMPITLVIWMVVALVTFFPIMTLNPLKQVGPETKIEPWQQYVRNILLALLICSVMFLVEKGSIHHLAVCYHRSQFVAKIEETNQVVSMLGSLYHASCSMFPVYGQEFHEHDTIISNHIRKHAPEDRCKKPLQFLQPVGHVDEDHADEAMAWIYMEGFRRKQGRGLNAARSVIIQALERKDSAEALARRLWMSFVVEGRYALYPSDIAEVLGGDPAEARECFRILDRGDNGDVRLDEMVLTLTEFGQARTSLNQTIYNIDAALQALDSLLLIVALLIGSLISLLFVMSTGGNAVTASATALLALCFLLATSAQEVLGSSIFLFVKRPFNVGDKVEIDGTPYTVQHISLLYTVLRSVTDRRVTQVPNYVLNTLFVNNLNRAQSMHEQFAVATNFDTTIADIQMLRDELELFVRSKENSREFMPDVNVEMTGIGNMDRLEVRVDIRHKSNWLNESVRAARRSKLIHALVLALKKTNIHAPGDKSVPPPGSAESNLSQSLQPRDSIGENQNDFRSVVLTDHLNTPSPTEGEGTRYQTPSVSPKRRVSSNPDPGTQSATRQFSRRRKVNSTGGVVFADSVPIISEPVPVQRPVHDMSCNPYGSSAGIRQQRPFSYNASQTWSKGDGDTSVVAGLFMSGGEQKG